MRYAILSDIHANPAALKAVLADAIRRGAGKIVCLGDAVGYGPDPEGAVATLRRVSAACVAGNHDDAVSGRRRADDFNDFAREAAIRHRKTLGDDSKAWLKSLPYVWEGPRFQGPDGPAGFACAHGDFANPPAFDYIFEEADAARSFKARAEPLLFVGHTHVPALFVVGASGVPHKVDPVAFVLESGKRYIVNPGSVGFPRSGTGVCFSSYCIFDDASLEVEFVTVPFDLRSVMPSGTGAVRPRRARAVLLAVAAAAAAGAAAFLLAPRERTVTRVETKVERIVETRTVTRTVPVTNTPPAQTHGADADGVNEIVRTDTLAVPDGVRHAYLSVELARGSSPARIHLVFKNPFGRVIGDEWISVKTKCGGRRGRQIGLPETTASVAAEVSKRRGDAKCEIVRWRLETARDGEGGR